MDRFVDASHSGPPQKAAPRRPPPGPRRVMLGVGSEAAAMAARDGDALIWDGTATRRAPTARAKEAADHVVIDGRMPEMISGTEVREAAKADPREVADAMLGNLRAPGAMFYVAGDSFDALSALGPRGLASRIRPDVSLERQLHDLGMDVAGLSEDFLEALAQTLAKGAPEEAGAWPRPSAAQAEAPPVQVRAPLSQWLLGESETAREEEVPAEDPTPRYEGTPWHSDAHLTAVLRSALSYVGLVLEPPLPEVVVTETRPAPEHLWPAFDAVMRGERSSSVIATYVSPAVAEAGTGGLGRTPSDVYASLSAAAANYRGVLAEAFAYTLRDTLIEVMRRSKRIPAYNPDVATVVIEGTWNVDAVVSAVMRAIDAMARRGETWLGKDALRRAMRGSPPWPLDVQEVTHDIPRRETPRRVLLRSLVPDESAAPVGFLGPGPRAPPAAPPETQRLRGSRPGEGRPSGQLPPEAKPPPDPKAARPDRVSETAWRTISALLASRRKRLGVASQGSVWETEGGGRTPTDARLQRALGSAVEREGRALTDAAGKAGAQAREEIWEAAWIPDAEEIDVARERKRERRKDILSEQINAVSEDRAFLIRARRMGIWEAIGRDEGLGAPPGNDYDGPTDDRGFEPEDEA